MGVENSIQVVATDTNQHQQHANLDDDEDVVKPPKQAFGGDDEDKLDQVQTPKQKSKEFDEEKLDVMQPAVLNNDEDDDPDFDAEEITS